VHQDRLLPLLPCHLLGQVYLLLSETTGGGGEARGGTRGKATRACEGACRCVIYGKLMLEPKDFFLSAAFRALLLSVVS